MDMKPMPAMDPQMPEPGGSPMAAMAMMSPEDMAMAMSNMDPAMLKLMITTAEEVLTGMEQDKGIDEADPASVV